MIDIKNEIVVDSIRPEWLRRKIAEAIINGNSIKLQISNGSIFNSEYYVKLIDNGGVKMKEWNKELLEQAGYKIENAKITKVDLSMADHGCLCAEIVLEGNGWTCVYGGFKIGTGYLGAKEFKGYEPGTEYIMRIMDTVGVSKYNQMAGKFIRVATLGWGDTIKIIGNIVEDKWFDTKSFFEDRK